MSKDMRYKAFQYTNSGFRMVVELATPCTLREMIRRLMHEFSTIELNKYPNWEPVEDEDLDIMEMPSPCSYCPRTAEDDCDDGCNCDRCLNSPHVCVDCENRKVEEEGDSCKTCAKENEYMAKMDKEQEEYMYGGDPNDIRTWIGSEPDVERWGDQI